VNPLFWVVLASAALSGFFALAGYSLRAQRRVQLEEALGGSAGARRLELLERHLTALQLTAAFGRSAANLVLVVAMVYWFGAPCPDWAHAIGAMGASAAIIAVFGVGIPHAWASHAGEKVIASTLGTMMVFRYALYPIIAIMQAFDVPVRRLAGVADPKHQDNDIAKQEILQMASEGQAEGSVEPEEVEMIESVMEFGRTQAGEIMTPRTDIFALPVDTPWGAAAAAIVEAAHSRVPIYQGDLDNIIGILYAKDLLRHTAASESASLRNVMRKPYFVPETKPLDDLLKEFKAGKVHIAVVLDEYGGTAGLITIEDLLEEIVGEISDEYDQPTPALMRRIDERAAEVDGRMYIDDLNDAMGLQVPEDKDYDTVAGLVFSELGYIPAVNETLEAYGARFTVLAADERRITKLRVQRLTNPREEEKE